MLILQIKLTLAAFVHRGIHQGLPSPQHVSPLIGMLVPASWVPERRAPPQSDLWSLATIEGLVCQVPAKRAGGPTWSVLFRAPREVLEKNGPDRRRSTVDGLPGALDPHRGA